MSNSESRKYVKTKFEGIFYRESTKRNARTGEYDRIYCFWYSDAAGKGHWKTVGRHSEGVRATTARNARSNFLAEMTKGINPIEMKKVTVGQVVEDYKTWSDNEGLNYQVFYNTYRNHVKDKIQDIPIADLTTSFLSKLRADFLKTPLKMGCRTKKRITKNHKMQRTIAPATVNKVFGFIRASINRAIATGVWNGNNPLSSKRGSWKDLPENNSRLRFLSPEEAKKLLDHLKDRHHVLHDLVLLSLRTGLRPTEMFRLKGQDVDANANVLHIVQKGGTRTPVKVQPDIIEMLAAYQRAPGEPVFQQPRKKERLYNTPQYFRTAIRKLGLETEGEDRLYTITLHTMRHTFASWLAQSGKVSIMEVQKLMRHKTINMTMRYAHLFPGQEAAKLSVVSDLLA